MADTEPFRTQGNRESEGVFRAGHYVLPLAERTLVVGILNLTPDSFSDGGLHPTTQAALDHARRMVAQGADIIDVGAESSRPGSEPVSLDEEMARLKDVLEALPGEVDVPLSIDTTKAAVAEEALSRGFSIVNDIWGFQRDPDMAHVAARHGAGCILMHNRDEADRGDVVSEVEAFLARSIAIAGEAGLPNDAVMIDPGIGFGKAPRESFRVLRALPRLSALGRPILVGPSRKRFIGAVTGRPVTERLIGTAAAVASAVALGASAVRVHDVAEMVEVVRVADAIRRG